MTNEERKKIINEIQTKLSNIERLESKRKEALELEKDPNVAKYISLICDIKQTEYDIHEYEKIEFSGDDILEKIIYKTFQDFKFSLKCNHDVMIYNGTNVMPKHPAFANFKLYSSPEENNPDIVRLQNCYKCLECDADAYIKMIDVKNYEQSHKILKRYDDENIVKYYQNMYYNLLYNNCDSKEAQNQICEQFQKDSEKILIKKRNYKN